MSNIRDLFFMPKDIYLASHSIGLLPKKTQVQADHFLDLWKTRGSDAWDEWLPIIKKYCTALARLLNANADEFCPQVNVSSALEKIVYSLPKRKSRKKIVLSELDFPSIGFVLETLKKRIINQNSSRKHRIPSAIEIVGQPFQNDYKISNIVCNRYIGPLHIIGCHKTATENQARKVLGFSDAIIIAAPFGIYVADEIQKIQFVFIVGCYDASSTKHGIQRFFNWLEQSNEKVSVVNRATSRANILQAIAREQKQTQ